MLRLYKRLADYNKWANARMLEGTRRVPDAAYKGDAGVHYQSLHGLWNHLILGDTLWLARFTGKKYPFDAVDMEVYPSLDLIARKRAELDETIIAFVRNIAEPELTKEISYKSIASDTIRCGVFGELLYHMLNHATHHRGQMAGMLEQFGIPYEDTDFALFQQSPTG